MYFKVIFDVIIYGISEAQPQTKKGGGTASVGEYVVYFG
jgi:hypothetical protein